MNTSLFRIALSLRSVDGRTILRLIGIRLGGPAQIPAIHPSYHIGKQGI
jgi:hypothetical protein